LLGDAYGRAGRLEEAVSAGERALDLARQLGQRGDEAHTSYLLGKIYGYGAAPNVDQARDCYQPASVLAHKLGMRPLEAHRHLALAELASKTGHGQEAQARLVNAVTMFREMGMRYWRERAEAALRTV
jgi:tetratricopeptide (TPR) repeat protein